MLLLILFAGCLASCAAQTTTPSSSPSTDPGGIMPPITNTTSPSPLQSTDNGTVLAYLVTTVKSYIELNETTIVPVIAQLKLIIQQRFPGVEVIVTVKNIDKI